MAEPYYPTLRQISHCFVSVANNCTAVIWPYGDRNEKIKVFACKDESPYRKLAEEYMDWRVVEIISNAIIIVPDKKD